jgi:DNA-binding CsgD family transcriptional regulator
MEERVFRVIPPPSAELAEQVRVRLGPGELRAVLEICRHSADRMKPEEQCTAILESLREIVPFEVAEISYWDPVREEHRTLVNRGYQEPYLRFLNEFSEEDWAYRLLRKARWPGRARDLPIPVSEHPIFNHYCRYGFDDGLTACLFASDGRYTGILNLNTPAPEYPSDRARFVIGRLAEIIGTVTDVTRTGSWLLSLLDPEATAVAVSRDGRLIELPGHSSHRLLDEWWLLVSVAWSLLEEHPHGASLLWRDWSGAWLRVRIFRVRGLVTDDSDHAIVSARPTELPYCLTPREIDVLTLVAQGASNARIAEELVTSVRTVTNHVEHILRKLGQSSRAGAAGLAVREGLIRLTADPSSIVRGGSTRPRH